MKTIPESAALPPKHSPHCCKSLRKIEQILDRTIGEIRKQG